MRYQALPTQARSTPTELNDRVHRHDSRSNTTLSRLVFVPACQLLLAALCVYGLSKHSEAQLSIIVLLVYPITTVIFAGTEFILAKFPALFGCEGPSTVLPVHKVLLILSTQILCLTVCLRYASVFSVSSAFLQRLRP